MIMANIVYNDKLLLKSRLQQVLGGFVMTGGTKRVGYPSLQLETVD